MHYCIHCGHALNEGQRFCTACGSVAMVENASSNAASVHPRPDLSYNASSPQAQKKRHSGLLVVLAVLFVLAAASIGGLVYAGY